MRLKIFCSAATLILTIGMFLFPLSACAADGRTAYTVKAGESIAAIAANHNVDTELLAAMNNLEPASKPAGGAQIWLPLEPGQAILVKKGDTLWSIAQVYDTEVEAIACANNLLSAEQLQIGDTVFVPSASGAESVAAMALPLAQNVVARADSSFQWPLSGAITSHFGTRGSGFHHGLDIAADDSTKIYAAKAGTVTFAGYYNSIYGNTVILDHGNRQTTLYAHLSSVSVKKEQSVTGKTVLGKAGATGNATGPHLHFQINIEGEAKDPLLYLR